MKYKAKVICLTKILQPRKVILILIFFKLGERLGVTFMCVRVDVHIYIYFFKLIP